MKKFLLGVFIALASLVPVEAQEARVVSACGSLPVAYAVGSTQFMTVDINGRVCSIASGYLPLSGGTLTFPSGGFLTFRQPSVGGLATASWFFSTYPGQAQELLLQNTASGLNTLQLQNTSPSGFSAVNFINDSNFSNMAVGVANSAQGFCGVGVAPCAYVEVSSFNGSSSAATFTGTITGNTTLTVSGITGVIAIKQQVTGAGMTSGAVITGGSGTIWTIACPTTCANVGPEAMTSGLSAAPFYFERTGIINGVYQTTPEFFIENAQIGIEGRMIWPALAGGASTNAFILDPFNDIVTVPSALVVGSLNSVITPVVALDNRGHTASGSGNAGSTRSTVCASWVYCADEATNSLLRLTHDGIATVNATVRGTSSGATDKRLNVEDNDNSVGVPLTVCLTGTGVVGFGGTNTEGVTTNCSSSHVGLVGNGTELDVKLADNSGFAPIKASTAIFSALANVATTSAVCYNTGTGVVTYDGTLGTCTVSDANLKNIDGPITGALDKLLRINGVYFHFKDPAAYGSGQKLGVTAQNVAEVFPELVSVDSNGTLNADYAKLTAPIIEAMRELKVENNNLKSCQSSWKCRLFGWR